ncbi:MAG: adenine phosphoribosyltransferase [Acidobacteria bacterium]|jgi:adenine phosphoribosyltransferase|nr:adenine phosphoribosyltransferase [Acidobacteriota bacterium]
MNLEAQVETLKSAIRDVPDFPRPGIVFKDITTLLQDPVLFRRTVDLLVVLAGDRPVDRIVAIESRGFLLGGALAHRLGAGLVLVRKPGKLPWKTVSASYELEYGEDSVEMHEDALGAGDRVLIVDDVIATGGTARAVGELTEGLGATIGAYLFLAELTFLNGRKQLAGHEILSLIRY